MKHDFEERKQKRIESYGRLAAKNERKAESLSQQSSDLASVIPMGQPILVGHHSERGHRRLLEKIRNKMDQSFKAAKTARYYDEKAEAAESNTAIFSDDPEAVTKLTAKIESLKSNQEVMKAVNAVIRNRKLSDDDKRTLIIECGLTDAQARKIMSPDFMGRIGFAGYSLSNNNANIRNCEKRLARLKTVEKLETSEKTFDVKDGEVMVVGVIMRNNVEANRLQLIFPGKPSEEMRKRLKGSGFRWSPSEGAWQRHLNNGALWAALHIVNPDDPRINYTPAKDNDPTGELEANDQYNYDKGADCQD